MDASIIAEALMKYGVMALVAGIIFGYIVRALSGSKLIGVISGIIIAGLICSMGFLVKPTCSDCGAEKEFGQNYCTACGVYEETENVFGDIKCDSCGRHIDSSYKICGYCGDEVT